MKATAQNQNRTTPFFRKATVAGLVFLCAIAAVFGGTESNESSVACNFGGQCAGTVSNNGVLVRLNAGQLQASVDATKWTDCRLTAITYLRALTYANGVFIAVGGSYFDEPGVIVTSRDGVHWNRRSLPNGINLYSVAFGNGTFVAVGDSGTILTSRDGTNWKRRESKVTGILLAAVAFGNSRFVVGGESGTILTSTNGVDWTASRLGLSVYVGAITFSDGAFVITSARMIFKSTDGSTWYQRGEELTVSGLIR